MEASRYPINLIPKICWRQNIAIEQLIGQQVAVYVARRIEGSREDCIDNSLGSDSAFLKSNALCNSDIPDMSLSLLGALLCPEDLCYRQIKEAMGDWDGKPVCSTPLIEDCVVECEKPWFAVAWNIKSLHDQTVPYKKEISGKKDYREFVEKINQVTEVIKMEFAEYKEAIAPLTATTKLKHAPSFLNYWHFLFEVYPMGSDTPLEDTKKKWANDLADRVAKQCLRYSYQYLDDLNINPLEPSIWEKDCINA